MFFTLLKSLTFPNVELVTQKMKLFLRYCFSI